MTATAPRERAIVCWRQPRLAAGHFRYSVRPCPRTGRIATVLECFDGTLWAVADLPHEQRAAA